MSFDLVSLQKDVESRKYKTDPFQKKFVDFTLTKFDSTIENDLTDVTEQNISNVTFNLKARSDLINAQMDYLFKSVNEIEKTLQNVNLPNSSLPTNNIKTKTKSKLIDDNTTNNDLDENCIFDEEYLSEKLNILEKFNENDYTELENILSESSTPWLEEFIVPNTKTNSKSADTSLLLSHNLDLLISSTLSPLAVSQFYSELSISSNKLENTTSDVIVSYDDYIRTT